VLAWLDRPGVRLVDVEGCWAQPWAGGRALAQVVDEARRVARAVRRDRQVLGAAKVVRRPPTEDATSRQLEPTAPGIGQHGA